MTSLEHLRMIIYEMNNHFEILNSQDRFKHWYDDSHGRVTLIITNQRDEIVYKESKTLKGGHMDRHQTVNDMAHTAVLHFFKTGIQCSDRTKDEYYKQRLTDRPKAIQSTKT